MTLGYTETELCGCGLFNTHNIRMSTGIHRLRTTCGIACDIRVEMVIMSVGVLWLIKLS